MAKSTRVRNPVSKALSGLTWLVQQSSDQIGVREMASALKIAPSNAHRILMMLSDCGFVRKDRESDRYVLGMEMFRLAQITLARVPIISIARPHMRKLATACHETVILGLYDDTRQQMIFAESIDSTNSLRYVIQLNAWMPVYAGASGLAIMAFLPHTTRQAIVSRSGLEPITTESITEPYRLENELEKIRNRGYAITHGQRIKGAVGMAAPILRAREVVGDICLTIPETRFDPASEERLAELLMNCANAVSKELDALTMERSVS